MSLRLTVDGVAYEGWVRGSVDRGLRRFAHSFSLTYVDKWVEDAERWPIQDEDPCVLAWGSQTLVDGYALKPAWDLEAGKVTLSVTGASRTIDLVQCSAIHKTGHWKDSTATTIVRDICEPFGISVSSGFGVVDTDRFARFDLKEGAKAFQEIDRVCKVRGLLPRTTPGGDVQLFNPEEPGIVLPLDVSAAKSRHYEADSSERYSDYLVRAIGVGTPEEANAEATITDGTVTRFRPLVVLADCHAAKVKQARQRAVYEANVRSGRGMRYVAVFTDPLNASGLVYSPGQRYRVADDYFGIDRELLVDRVSLSVDKDHVLVRLEMVRPETYSQSEFTRKRLTTKTQRKRKRRRGVNPFL